MISINHQLLGPPINVQVIIDVTTHSDGHEHAFIDMGSSEGSAFKEIHFGTTSICHNMAERTAVKLIDALPLKVTISLIELKFGATFEQFNSAPLVEKFSAKWKK